MRKARRDGLVLLRGYVFRAFVQAHHYKPKSGFGKLRTNGHNLSQYKNELGFEQIAIDLGITYPTRLPAI